MKKTIISMLKTNQLRVFLLASFTLLIVVACSGAQEGATIGEARATAEVRSTEQAIAVIEQSENALKNVTAYCDEHPLRCIDSGNPESDIVVFEFSDYGCPGCKSFNDNIAPEFISQYVDTGEVRFLKVISAPMYPARWDTRYTAEAVVCANELGQGAGFHKGIFDVQVAGGNATRQQMGDVAEDVGLNRSNFLDCVDSNRHAKAVNETTVLAQENGVTLTPTVMVNGQKPASTSLSSMGQLISQLQQQ